MNKIIPALFILLISVVQGTEFNITEPGEAILNIYLDESGNAVIFGYINDENVLKDLELSQVSEYIFDKDTNQVYLITSSITSKRKDVWIINLTSNIHYSDYDIAFFLPVKSTLIRLEGTEDLNYRIYSQNESFVIEFFAVEIQSPEIVIKYKIPLGYPEINKGGYESYALLILPLGIILLFLYFRRQKSLKKLDLKPKIRITSEMQKVIDTLSEREKTIVNTLINSGGKLDQSKIRYETEIPKSSLTGILNSLERKKIIKRKRYGRKNIIELTDWFLSEDKED